MALIPIMGQPVNLVPDNETPYGCPTENRFCSLYGKEEGENIMFQMTQTPCGETLVTNGDFLNDSAWTYDANVIIEDNVNGGKATHVVGSSGEIYQDIYSAYALLDYFSVFFTVTGMSAGSIDVYIGSSTANFTITENGIYKKYLYPPFTDTEIKFVFSADCDASISSISSYKLLNETEIIANLLDGDGTEVADFTLEMLDEFVCFNLSTASIGEGCYTIVVIDPCAASDFDNLTEVFEDTLFDAPSEWTATTDIGNAPFISGGAFKDPADYWGKNSRAIQPFNIPTGERLFAIAEVETGTLFTGGMVSIVTDVDGSLVQFGDGVTLPQNTVFTKMFLINPLDVSNVDMWLEHQASFDIYYPTPTANSGYLPGDNNEFKKVSLRVAPASEVTGVFFSNCIKVSSDVSDTRIVEGFADEVNAYPVPNRSLGFMFHSNFFWLRARLAVSFSNPHTPTITANNLYSSGRRKKTYAQLTKAWDLTFVEADQNMHDTIANIINCDEFTIDGNEYITEEKEYTANYGGKGVAAVAESTIEVIKIEGTRFNTNV